MQLWHGSPSIVKQPRLELCRHNNDYGRGFYCTPDPELAKEWATSSQAGGFANHYELDAVGLTVIDLECSGYTVLNWMALLAQNRVFQTNTPVAERGLAYLLDNFLPDVTRADLICGYRADDSYFSFARAFVSNQISVEQLSQALKLGKLGRQVMVKSPKAFERLRYLGCEPANNAHYARRTNRDQQARETFVRLRSQFDENGLFMADILREKVTNDDERLR